MLEKLMLRDCFRRRRCLVPVDTYFEWQVLNPATKRKQPWAVAQSVLPLQEVSTSQAVWIGKESARTSHR